MKELKFYGCGTKYFGETVDITDPCYDKDVWCRMTAKIIPGNYNCNVMMCDNRIAKIFIVKEGENAEHEMPIGCIGVDAGLAGFFNDKPDYSDGEWEQLCDVLNRRDEMGYLPAYFNDCGFFSSSGWGDGVYAVMELLNKDKTKRIGLSIIFIDDTEDEDEDEDEE